MKKIFILLICIIFIACNKEPVETVFFDLDSKNGVFIACEGNFMYSNGSVSFYNIQNNTVVNQLFYAKNNVPLGDVPQSLALQDNTLFVVINNSGKIYVVDADTFEFIGSLTGLTSPRKVHFISKSKAYVSDLYAHHITIFNPQTLEKFGKVDLNGHTSEEMMQINNKLFVTEWFNGKNIFVIDTETDRLVDNISVPSQPKELRKDKNGKLWVLCSGEYENVSSEEQYPALVKIDPIVRNVEKIFRFEKYEFPNGLEMNLNADTLFYLKNDFFKMSIDAQKLPEKPFIKAGDKMFYSFGVDKKNNEFYLADAIDYTQKAIVYRYSKEGNIVDSFRVGINPAQFLFK